MNLDAKPSWHVLVATDDGQALHISTNDLGQCFIAASESQKLPRHVCTLNRKTQALDNLIDALIEAKDQLEAQADSADNEPLQAARAAGL